MPTWLVVTLAVWITLALALALVVGASISRADREEGQAPPRIPDHLPDDFK